MNTIIKLIILCLLTSSALADTPGSSSQRIIGNSDGTKIGNVADALKVNVTNSGGTSTVNQGTGGVSPWSVYFLTPPTILSQQSGSWTAGRTWTLLNSTDSITAFEGGVWNVVASGTVTANIGTTNGLALDSSVATTNTKLTTINTTLGSPFQSGGSIGNSSFGISGTLPAFTSTPTFNIGTTGGIALDSSLTALSAKFGSLGQKNMTGSAPVVIASDQSPIPVTGAFPSNYALETGGHLSSVDTKLTTINTTLGSPFQAGGSIGNTSFIANAGTNLNTSALALDTSVNSLLKPASTLAAVTTLGTITNALPTGTNSIGQVTANAGTNLNTSALNLESTQSAFKTATHTDLGAINTTLTNFSSTNGSSVPANGVLIAGSDGTNARTISTDGSGVVNVKSTAVGVTDNSLSLTVTAQDTASTSTTMSNGQVFVTGTPTANSTANFILSSYDSIEVQVTGTWTGTLSTEISQDGGNTWIARGVKQSGTSYIANSFTNNFQGGMNFAGMTNFRVRGTAAMTGTATVAIKASLNPGSIIVSNPQMLRDGTTQSITNTIKAGSTAATTGDTAVVVALSPNTAPLSSINVTGSGSAAAATVSTVITLTAPANAVGFILMCLDTSTANIRWSVGRTATATLGQQLQPGRDTGFVPIGANVSVVAESGTQNYDIQWIAR